MDGYASVSVFARLQAFGEAILGPGIETTPIVRSADDQLDSWSCEIYSRRNCYSLRSGGGHVRLFAEQLDDRNGELVLLGDVEPNEEGLDTLRTLLAGWELISELSARRNGRGLQALWCLLEDGLVSVTGARRSALRCRRGTL
jgi:hypothetical protein